MQEFTVRLSNGRTYIVRASSQAEATRLANQDQEGSGVSIDSITENTSPSGLPTPVRTSDGNLGRGSFSYADYFPTEVPEPILTSDGNLGRGSFSYADYFPGMEGREAEVTMGNQSVPVSQLGGVKEAIQYLQDDSVSDKDKEVFTRDIMTDAGPGGPGGPGGPVNRMVQGSTPSLPSLPDIPLEELDLFGAYQRGLGLLDRSLQDPYRRYLEGEYDTFLQPYRFGRAFGNKDITGFDNPSIAIDREIDVPTFQEYVTRLGTPQAAREQARSVFSNVISGEAGPEFQNLIGGPFRIDPTTGQRDPDQIIGTQTYGMLGEPEQGFLSNLGDLGRRALEGRIGRAAYGLVGGLLPSVGQLYNQYYNEAQQGNMEAPTFGTYLQGAYGI